MTKLTFRLLPLGPARTLTRDLLMGPNTEVQEFDSLRPPAG